MGRPTKYNEQILEKAQEYLVNYKEYDDSVPSAVGLACALDISRSTLYAWAEEHDEFSYILSKVNETQERKLLTGGLEGDFNSNIVKLMLGKHGYSDKHDIDQSIVVNIGKEWDGV